MKDQEKTTEISIYLDRLTSLMKSKSLSQSELSRITKIRQATISDYVKGNSIPSAERFARIADALGVSMDYLWGKTDQKTLTPIYTPSDSSTPANWQDRALLAEKKLAHLKSLLTGLGSDVQSLGTTVNTLVNFITE